MALSNGNYYISCTLGTASGYLQFGTGGAGVNMTSWQYSGGEAQQVCLNHTEFCECFFDSISQWAIAAATTPTTYTFQNIGTQNYATWDATQPAAPGVFIVSNPIPMAWYIQQQTLGLV